MKVLSKHISGQRQLAKVWALGRLVTLAGLAQALIKLVGLLSGILIVRLLPTQEYALYTLANAMLGTMTVLADGGIATGVLSRGGAVWQDRTKLGAVLATGLDLRKKFAVGSLLVAIPILLYLLRHHGASWLMALLIVASLIPAFFSALSGSLLQIAPKLQQDIAPLQKNEVATNLGRLFLTMLTLFVFPWAFVAVLASGIPQIWANLNLRKISASYADWNQKPDPAESKEILSFVKRLLPGAIYYCVSGQVSIWLISVFGSTASIAQLGALTRLSMMFGFLHVLLAALVVPRFARLPNKRRPLMKNFVLLQFGLIVLGAGLVVFVAAFSDKILWLFGESYMHLSTELVMVAVAACISFISSSTHQLLSSRKIIVPPLLFISCALAAQVGAALTVRLDEVMGVILFGVYTSTAIYSMRLIYLLFIIKRHESFSKS